MDDIEIEMQDRDRDREEQREREEEVGDEDLDDRQQETDFGGTSHDDNSEINPFPNISQDFRETPKSRYNTKKDNTLINFIRSKFKVRGFSFDTHDPNVLELRNRTELTTRGNIKFRPSGQTKDFVGKQVVLKVVDGELAFNEGETPQRAVNEFKGLLQDIVERTETKQEMSEGGLLVFTTPERDVNLPGLTPQENRELRGSLIPGPDVLPETRDEALRVQADHFSELLNEEQERLDNEDNLEEFVNLGERVAALREARDLTLEQKGLEGVRNQQEEDITRLQKVKRWLKENLVGLSAIGITIAGIITTIVVAGRKALVQTGNALGAFGKAAIKTLKALVPVLTPLLNILATVLGWAAKGLTWLASNLWALVLFGVLLLYRWMKAKRAR